MSEQRQRRLRRVGIGWATVAMVIALVGGTWRTWWLGWPAFAGWLAAWWWLLAAAAMALTAGCTLLASRRPARPIGALSRVVWEPAGDRSGLIARTATLAPASGRGDSRPPRNWSAITSAVTAFTALAALVFTAQSLSATRDEINVAETGQITDRYTTAIDQIGTQGPDHLETRLGGIYALERLAHDSPSDQPTIVQVLSAFVRSSLPQTTFLPNGRLDSQSCPPAGATARPLGLDVQAALTVLGRRDHTKDNGAVTDLRTTCLTGADLTGVDLADANLAGANLDDANLSTENLDGANLNGASLNGAHLSGSNLPGASLDGTNLAGADLSGTILDDASLAYANLDGANLGQASLDNADLRRASLVGANLDDANLTSAGLVTANLVNANLDGTNLDDVSLDDANLTHAEHNQSTNTSGAATTGATGVWW